MTQTRKSPGFPGRFSRLVNNETEARATLRLNRSFRKRRSPKIMEPTEAEVRRLYPDADPRTTYHE